MAKSAWVQSGLAASTRCEANACTAAVTELMLTEPGFGLVNVPASAAVGPPGYSPPGEPVWLTVIADVVPAVEAPDPLAPWVQYARARPPMASATVSIARLVNRAVILTKHSLTERGRKQQLSSAAHKSRGPGGYRPV